MNCPATIDLDDAGRVMAFDENGDDCWPRRRHHAHAVNDLPGHLADELAAIVDRWEATREEDDRAARAERAERQHHYARSRM